MTIRSGADLRDMRDQIAELAKKARSERRIPMAERLEGLVLMLDWVLCEAERFITDDGLRLPPEEEDE